MCHRKRKHEGEGNDCKMNYPYLSEMHVSDFEEDFDNEQQFLKRAITCMRFTTTTKVTETFNDLLLHSQTAPFRDWEERLYLLERFQIGHAINIKCEVERVSMLHDAALLATDEVIDQSYKAQSIAQILYEYPGLLICADLSYLIDEWIIDIKRHLAFKCKNPELLAWLHYTNPCWQTMQVFRDAVLYTNSYSDEE